jgi:hypothetical protein
MKTKHYFSGFLLLTVLCVFFSSCQKNKDENCTASVASISGSYKLTSLQYKINAGTPAQDYLVFLDACERDDIVTLNSNGTWSSQDAGVVCIPNGNDNGTWSLSGSIINSDGLIDGTIESFDCRTLVFFVADIYTNGDRLTFSMVKQ